MSDPLDDALNEALAAEEKLSTDERKKLGGLPCSPPGADADEDAFAEWLSVVFYDRVTGAVRWGDTGDTPVTVFLAGGRELRWDEQDDLQTLTRLRSPLIRAGLRPRALTPHGVGLVAWAITRLAVLRANSTARDEATSWGTSYLRERPLYSVARSDQAVWRQALAEWQEIDDYDPRGGVPRDRRPFVLLDTGSNERFVRRGDFAGHARKRSGARLSPRKVAARMAEVEWQQDRLQYAATASGAPYVQARVYVLPSGWPEGLDG
jgi:hypothetical protein